MLSPTTTASSCQAKTSSGREGSGETLFASRTVTAPFQCAGSAPTRTVTSPSMRPAVNAIGSRKRAASSGSARSWKARPSRVVSPTRPSTSTVPPAGAAAIVNPTWSFAKVMRPWSTGMRISGSAPGTMPRSRISPRPSVTAPNDVCQRVFGGRPDEPASGTCTPSASRAAVAAKSSTATAPMSVRRPRKSTAIRSSRTRAARRLGSGAHGSPIARSRSRASAVSRCVRSTACATVRR